MEDKGVQIKLQFHVCFAVVPRRRTGQIKKMVCPALVLRWLGGVLCDSFVMWVVSHNNNGQNYQIAMLGNHLP